MSNYKEKLIQWIWNELEFDCTNLKTTCGKPLEIIHRGYLNSRNGPDFLNARLVIGGMHWFGDVEIHTNAGDWFNHHHHKDPAFNKVVLHVVYKEDGRRRAYTADNFTPYVFCLKPVLMKPLYHLLEKSEASAIPCGGLHRDEGRTEHVFHGQIEKASREYFSYKVNGLIRWYNPEKGPVEAWRECLITGVWDALGVPYNREPMVQLAKDLLSQKVPAGQKHTAHSFVEEALESAFGGPEVYSWKRGGVRPSGRPEKRVMEAAAMHQVLNGLSPTALLKEGLDLLNKLESNIPKSLRIGKQMREVVWATVWLPALWLLGDLLASEPLRRNAFEAWEKQKLTIPARIRKAYARAGLPVIGRRTSPGVIHQYKRYCRDGRCTECELFKYSIRS